MKIRLRLAEKLLRLLEAPRDLRVFVWPAEHNGQFWRVQLGVTPNVYAGTPAFQDTARLMSVLKNAGLEPFGSFSAPYKRFGGLRLTSVSHRGIDDKDHLEKLVNDVVQHAGFTATAPKW